MKRVFDHDDERAPRPASAPYRPSGWDGGEGKIFGLASAGGGSGGASSERPSSVGARGRGAAKAGGSSILGRIGGDKGGVAVGTKVIVSKLADDITGKDMAELFGTIGEVLSAQIEYRAGSSTGRAQVVFAQQSKVFLFHPSAIIHFALVFCFRHVRLALF